MNTKIALAAALILVLLTFPAMAEKKPNVAASGVEADTPVAGGGAESMSPEVVQENRNNPRRNANLTTTPMQPMIRKVSVLIESNPTNSDIEIDGVYVGSTPVQLSLKEGVHHVKIAREGFLAWSRTVKAYNGLMVSPTLVSTSSEKKDITRSAEIK